MAGHIGSVIFGRSLSFAGLDGADEEMTLLRGQVADIVDQLFCFG
jgi:hypothetical protein